MTQIPPFGQNPLPYQGGYAAPAPKPSSITVVAVLAIVFGSLGTLCCGAVGVFGALANTMQQNKTVMPDGTILTMDPGVSAFNAAIATGDLVTSILLLVAGIGALSLKSWARSLAVMVSVAIIVLAVVYVVGVIAYTGPKTEEMFKAMEQSMARSTTQPAVMPGFSKFISAGTIGMGVLMFILRVITPALILFLWTKAHIKAWFNGSGPAQQGYGGYPPR